MEGIYVAAIVTTAFAVFVLCIYVILRAPRKEKPFLLAAAFFNLPLSPLAYYLVRMPFDRFIGKWLEAYPDFFLFVRTFYAPLTEEPAKLWLLLIPFFARRVTRENVARVALALGVGFGIGEIWLVAQFVAANAEYAAYPWYYFGGFMGERLMVCLMHGAFTAAALWRLRRGFILGLMTAMALHYVGNFPIYLAAIDLFSLSKTAWQTILSVWILAYLLLMLTVMAFFAYGKLQPGRIFFGLALCPDCGVIYPRPFWGLNLGTKRYEKCPACKKWHKTREFTGPLETEDGKRVPIYGYEEEKGAGRRK